MTIVSKRLSGVPYGFEPLVLRRLLSENQAVVYVLPDENKLSFVRDILEKIAPRTPVFKFPAWDTVPYDRTAPNPEIIGERLSTLIRLSEKKSEKCIVLITAAALMQRVVSPSFLSHAVLKIGIGETHSFETLKAFLIRNGYRSADMVMETGEFAIRGGLMDIFPSGEDQPIRIDFFGDEIDTIKTFDPITQRTLKNISEVILKPIREFILTPESISLFRTRHRDLFDRQTGDAFYEAVSDGRYIQGLEHFLPLFHKELVPFWTYIPDAIWVWDFQVSESLQARQDQIQEYYESRRYALTDGVTGGALYQPIPPELLFLTTEMVEMFSADVSGYSFSPFIEAGTKDAGGRAGHDFTDVRIRNAQDVFGTVAEFIRSESRQVIISAFSVGSADRLAGLLRDRGLILNEADTWEVALKKSPSLLVAPFEKGFSTDKFILITETDILGDRIIRTSPKRRKSDFIDDLTTLNIGDLVVHQQHGIGRFMGLVPLQIAGAAHDCLYLEYDGHDKLFIPVENMDVLSRYGNAENVGLDKLGGTAFVTRKERVKKDLFQMAAKLMAIASGRAINQTERILAPHGFYQEFCAHFPYTETEDQTRTIHEIESDLAGGKPMDRLVCGDVGFGKTEVAMRAAFLAVMAGYQVAVIVPTTLLARQHTQNFTDRFRGFPVRIDGLSRLTTASRAKKIKEELKEGKLDIVIGTHALLTKGIQYKKLGLVVVDEEQHFGVAHKERLKELKQGVHVLTLTATPIPRTLQLSLAGVRELSIIATPPVDRLAVKTFVTPFDPVIIKEAILREHFRGGQTFFVCPRISDMAEVSEILSKLVPDIRVVQAHGQMSSAGLENIMMAFSEHQYDVLLATSIIESGLDMPSVNTIIVYRADMFGLAALYQLRGRVGRGKLKAYAYLTTPAGERLSDTAQKRLTVMQGLDSLGAGFALASHDLDIRGAGNLLGREQSGHIREVGVALYQKMLGDAIRDLKRNGNAQTSPAEEDYSPQMTIGVPVLLPENYVANLDIRMGLYHRMGDMTSLAEVESLRAELTDRFGPYPPEVENLLQTIELKIMAKVVHIDRLDAGPKGATISFRNNIFPNPAGLIAYMESQMGTIRIRPDQKLVVMRPWANPTDRLTGVRNIIKKLADIVQAVSK